MDIQQCEDYKSAVVASAKSWVTGYHSIDNQMEILIIADYYGVELPMYFHHFKFSNNPNHVCATGAHKSILKKLEKLSKVIKANECLA